MERWIDGIPGSSPPAARPLTTVRYGRPGHRPPGVSRGVRPQPLAGESVPRTVRGSHMPLDTGLHARWNNPLNVIPLLIIIFLVLALVALIV